MPVRRAFTLVELMIVISVIGILVTMLFSVIIGAKEKARKKQALVEAHKIVLAAKTYRMEFGKWPNQTQGTNDTTYFTNNYLVALPLLGQNARGKVFLAVQATNQTDAVTNLVDPWGVPYVICFDENSDLDCSISVASSYANNFAVPPTVYSYSASYSAAGRDAAVGSFACGVSTSGVVSTLSVETWSDPQ